MATAQRRESRRDPDNRWDLSRLHGVLLKVFQMTPDHMRVEDSDLRVTIVQALNQLPLPLRRALVLRAVGYDFVDICLDVYGDGHINPAADGKKVWVRGIRALRDVLEGRTAGRTGERR